MSKKLLRLYLDNCCYNRPYDDQSQIRISLEAQAEIFIQNAIKAGSIELAASHVLLYENSRNPHENRRQAIYQFIKQNTSVFVDVDRLNETATIARKIMSTGIKDADAAHIACAIQADCDYFLTTDSRILKYRDEQIKVMNPVDFIKIFGGDNNE